MALYYDLPLYKETYQFVIRIFSITCDFDREYKYSLGQDMKHEAISLVRNIYRANKHRDKRPYLEQFLDDIEVLKLELRLCRDMKLISVKKYAEVFESIGNIARQVNGWKKSSTNDCSVITSG